MIDAAFEIAAREYARERAWATHCRRWVAGDAVEPRRPRPVCFITTRDGLDHPSWTSVPSWLEALRWLRNGGLSTSEVEEATILIVEARP